MEVDKAMKCFMEHRMLLATLGYLTNTNVKNNCYLIFT